MDGTVLKAIERTEKSKKVRKSGFVPGVVYGGTLKTSTPVKFDAVAVKRLVSQHGHSAKIFVEFNNDKKLGFIKEIQRDVLNGSIEHIDMQLVSQDEIVRVKIPIAFEGVHKIEMKKLILQINKDEIEASGKAEILPESVVVDVSGKEAGDNITIKDIPLDHQIKVHDDPGEIYAVVVVPGRNVTEEGEKIEEGGPKDEE